MAKVQIKATTLKTAMGFVIFIVTVSLVVGFYFTQDALNLFATKVNSTISKSVASDGSPNETKLLQDEIIQFQASSDKAASLIASSQDYQNKIIQDLSQYASSAGISITDYSFSATAPTATNTSPLGGGVSKNYIKISLNNPVVFTNLMQFLKSIESNAPKMQLTGINLNLATSSNSTVTVEPLTIEFYTR